MTRVLQIDGTRLLLDGAPFYFQGLSFFNAIYNPTFNRDASARLRWLETFREHGVNALRVWCQWDSSTGTVQFGGIEGGRQPEQHIAQIQHVREVGGYHTYHHDMFQNGYGHPATPPEGLPDPDFSPFHRRAFDFLRQNRTW